MGLVWYQTLQAPTSRSFFRAEATIRFIMLGAKNSTYRIIARPLLVSVPSSGSRKDVDSRHLLGGKVYTPNPNESSGNALGNKGSMLLGRAFQFTRFVPFAAFGGKRDKTGKLKSPGSKNQLLDSSMFM